MNVLVDYHHGGLIYSLYKLFEEQLGWQMFRPIGYDWFTHGYFRIAEPYNNAQDTIKQYLEIANRPYEPYVFLNGDPKLVGNVYYIQDPENNFTHRAITFETFKDMHFDLIVATFPLHENWELLRKYHPEAKFIMQLGNEGQDCSVKNIMCSVWGYHSKPGQNIFYYHQKIDTNHYWYAPPKFTKNITSFVIGLPERELYFQYKDALPEFNFKAYGPGAIDGNLSKREMMGKVMRDSLFGWHVKPADGFGHLIHSWYACGRPVITRGNYYQGKTGGMLLTDQETCIDLDKHSFEENVELIRHWAKPENYIKMSQNAIDRFKNVVNYDDEENRFKEWIKQII